MQCSSVSCTITKLATHFHAFPAFNWIGCLESVFSTISATEPGFFPMLVHSSFPVCICVADVNMLLTVSLLSVLGKLLAAAQQLFALGGGTVQCISPCIALLVGYIVWQTVS